MQLYEKTRNNAGFFIQLHILLFMRSIGANGFHADLLLD